MTRFYVEAINDPDNIPDVQTAWETYVQAKCKEARDKALMAYDKNMKEELSVLPRETEKILASHESAARKSMAIFEDETVGITTDNTRLDCKELMVCRAVKFAHYYYLDKMSSIICLSDSTVRFIPRFKVFPYSFLRAIPKIFKRLFSRLSFVKST